MIIHVHLVLAACLLWLLALMPALLWAPSSVLLTVSTTAQFLVFVYGLSLYISWLTRRPSRWLRPLFWWLPQLAVITVCTYDPATSVMGPPVGGFCAAMPLQVSASAGWHLGHRSVAIGLNFLALFGVIWSMRRPWTDAVGEIAGIRLPLSRLRRVGAVLLVGAPLLVIVIGGFARAMNIYTWVKQPPPKELQQITLASGKVIQTSSLAPVRWPNGESLLLLEYFTDLSAPDQGPALRAEALEVWDHFRPVAETSGYKTAAIAITARPTQAVYVLPHLKKLAWIREDDGAWHEVAGGQSQ